MSNCYSWADMRASTDFDQSLFTAPAFHSASPVYSRIEESSANTSASSTNRSDIDKGSDTKLNIEDLSVEYR
jgi:hypothetical protein